MGLSCVDVVLGLRSRVWGNLIPCDLFRVLAQGCTTLYDLGCWHPKPQTLNPKP